ncbi:MAG: HPF/RaiA family ribosome-associated protein [Planctomycetales bacterium]
MQVPLDISFRHVEPSEEIKNAIRERAAKLEEFFDRITSCKVIVEAPHHHHRAGNDYLVRIRIAVPRREISVDRGPGLHQAHPDLHVTIRDAFDEARRQLQDYVREMRGDVKSRETPPHGRILRFFPQDGYGFIAAPDGREIYFHANSLIDTSLDQLEVGDEVRFAEEEGEQGPQATAVRLVGRHHHFVG